MKKPKLRANSGFEQTQKLPSGLRWLRSLRKNNKPNPKNTNKLKIRTNPKIANRVNPVCSAKTTTNHIQKAKHALMDMQACNRCTTTIATQIVESLTLSGRIILSYSSDHQMTRHSVFINYKFCLKRFSLKPIFIEVVWKTWKKRFFWVLTLKMSFAPIFVVIFVISKSKYVGIRSFKATGGITLSKIHSR